MKRSRDAARTRFLAERGIRVLRFWNHDVFEETEAVLESIARALVGSGPEAVRVWGG
jgi:very-short-patch-repair endonuclease